MKKTFFLIFVSRLQQFSLLSICTFFLIIDTAHASNETQLNQWLSPLEQQHPLTGQIIATQSGQAIVYEQLVNQLSQARFILIGEKHDNPDHHRLELKLLNDLLLQQNFQVTLEMLDDTQDTEIANLIRNKNLTDELIQNRLNWSAHGWPWEDYGAIVKTSLKHAEQLRSGNISRKTLMSIYRGSDNQILDTARFQSMNHITDEMIKVIQQQVLDSHCGTLTEEHSKPMARIQLARDASMAYALSNTVTSNGRAILIAGGFHIRKDYGVPAHLEALNHSNMLTVQLMEVAKQMPEWESYLNITGTKAPDFIWFTPKITDKDYCESLRKTSNSEGKQQ